MNLADSLCCDSVLADTLCREELQDTAVLELRPFDEGGFFSRDSLLHSEVPYRPYGFAGETVPFRLRSDAWSGLLLLVCLLLAASLVMRLGRKLGELTRDVLFPIPGKKEEPIVDDPLRRSTRLVSVVLLSLSAAMLTFCYEQHDVDFYTFPETPYVLFGVFFLLWTSYFVAKRMLSGFVEWVFFRQEKIQTMSRARTFLYAAESLLLFVVALAATYLPLSLDEVLVTSLLVVIFVKILLLFKAGQLFFPKFYGALHLFVYFCTLEVMPLLVMTQVLTYAEAFSAVKL